MRAMVTSMAKNCRCTVKSGDGDPTFTTPSTTDATARCPLVPVTPPSSLTSDGRSGGTLDAEGTIGERPAMERAPHENVATVLVDPVVLRELEVHLMTLDLRVWPIATAPICHV